jgi:periplasmic protein TonB
MEPKKNPKYDVHRLRGILFNLSLAVSLVVVILAFNWVMPVSSNNVAPKHEAGYEPLAYVHVTTHEEKAEAAKAIVKKVLFPTEFDTRDDQKEDNSLLQKFTSDPENATGGNLDTDEMELPEEAVDDGPFIYVENMPEPIGGYDAFFKKLNKLMKYPAIAKRNGTEGKVFVQFTILETGEITDLKVLKGIGSGCDEEALRVLALTRWSPGKQRGKPVKVKMVQPVYFALK